MDHRFLTWSAVWPGKVPDFSLDKRAKGVILSRKINIFTKWTDFPSHGPTGQVRSADLRCGLTGDRQDVMPVKDRCAESWTRLLSPLH